MAGDEERLFVTFEARIKDLEKNMAKAEKVSTGTYSAIKKGSKSATRQMERDMQRSTGRVNQALAVTSNKIGVFGKTLVGGLVAGGIAGIVSQVGQVASAVAEIGDEAKRAGVNVKAFQELKFVAEQNRIGVDSLTDGLKELNLRADEFITTGAGSAAEAFQRIGYDAETLKAKLDDPSALFTEIIGKLGQLDKAAQIRIADEIFGGTGGEKFVQLIDQGEAGINNTIDKAHELGVVMDEELIKKAAALDQKFSDAATTVGTQLKAAIVDVAGDIALFLELYDKTARQSDAILDRRLASIGKRKLAIENELLKANGARREAADLPNGPARIAIIDDRIATWQRELAALQAQEKEITGAFSTRQNRPSDVVLPSSGLPGKPGKGDGDGKGRSSSTSKIDAERKAVQNLIAGLEFEKSLIGLSALEQEKLNTLRQAGAAATEDQRIQISELVEQTYLERESAEQLAATYDMIGQVGTAAFQGIIDAMADGKIEAEELGSILSNVLSMAGNFFLQAGLKGIGGAFGFPGFASGTNNAPGGLAWVGEQGPELMHIPRGAQIFPHQQSMNIANNNTPAPKQSVGSLTVNVNFSGGAKGNAEIAEMVQKGVNQALRYYDGEVLPNRVQQVMADKHARGGSVFGF